MVIETPIIIYLVRPVANIVDTNGFSKLLIRHRLIIILVKSNVD